MQKTKLIVTMALEGWIEEYFLPQYFRIMCSEYSIDFDRNLQIANPLPNQPMGKDANLKRLPAIAQEFLSFSLTFSDSDSIKSILLFGVDLEWKEAGKRIESGSEIEEEIARIQQVFNLGTKKIESDKKVLFVPIRCFDTWVSYLENETTTQGHFEKISNEEIKINVYGSKRSSQIKSERVVNRLKSNGLLSNKHFQRLQTQSPSFSHFHQQIISYLQNNS